MQKTCWGGSRTGTSIMSGRVFYRNESEANLTAEKRSICGGRLWCQPTELAVRVLRRLRKKTAQFLEKIRLLDASCRSFNGSFYPAEFLLPLQAFLMGWVRPILLSNQSSGSGALHGADPGSQRSCSTSPPQCAEVTVYRFRLVPPSVPGSNLPRCEAGSQSVLRSHAVGALPQRHKCRKERLLITVVYAVFFLARGHATPLLSPNRG